MAEPDNINYGEIDFSDPSTLVRKPYYQKRCSIMVTLTNPQISAVDLQKMMEAGMNMTRFKMISHTKKEKIQSFDRIRDAADACCRKFGVNDWPITTSIELKTYIMTTGILEEDLNDVTLKEGSEVILTNNVNFFNKCNAKRIFIDNAYLTVEAKVGDEICIGCDEITLICKEIINDKSVKCVVVIGGKLENTAIVSIRGVIRNRPEINERDLEWIQFALDNKVDMIVIKYLNHGDTIKKVKEIIAKKKCQQPLILAGICTEQALESIDEILKVSDAIVLSREYLSHELEASKRFRLNNIQKWVAAKCYQVGKPLYLSGAVFVHALRTGEFKDAEVADIFNAVLDGFAGFVLRDCENVQNTLDAVKLLNEICCAADPFNSSSTSFWQLTDQLKLPVNAAEACLMSCVAMANQAKARAIVLVTKSGRTAQSLLRMRPTCLVLAICNSQRVTRKLLLHKSIMPILFPTYDSGSGSRHSSQKSIEFAVKYGLKRGWLSYEDVYVILRRTSEFNCYCDLVGIRNVTITDYEPLDLFSDPSLEVFKCPSITKNVRK